MEVYRDELKLVNEELDYVQGQINDLFDRQSSLEKKKAELEEILKQSTSKKESEDESSWEKNDFVWSQDLEQTQKTVFNIDKLRPLQLKTMNVTMSKKDCMLIMPTGGGKSLCFQLPAVISKGITLVVSPLLSLMEDQLMALKKIGVKAAMLNASAPNDAVKHIQDSMVNHNSPLTLLYVTPEKLAKSKRFMAKLEKMYEMGRFARLVIDEVHCCSQWGHDFRPDYKFLGIMKRQFPEVPILGLTATATLSVLRDVQSILNISPERSYLFRASFNRPNLYYEVRQKPATAEKTLDDIVSLIRSDFKGQPGIIYCFSKKEVEEIYPELNRRGITAGCYHADLSPKDRSQFHQWWMENKIQVIVATIAFGMGIDKPDVRYVIHHSISKSMENLYQESGRAGRDDLMSRCIVYYRLADVFRQSSMVFTEQTGLENLMGIVQYCTNSTRCRRSMIARHFGEVWESSDCDGMCDHCDPARKESLGRVDITSLCCDVITILDHASSQSQRLTAIKLMDTWHGKGSKPMKGSGAEITCFSREECEFILSTMLQEGYVKEDFHFTPYSTISYLVPGHKAVTLRHQSAEITITIPDNMFTSLPRLPPKSPEIQTKKGKTEKQKETTEKPKERTQKPKEMTQKLKGKGEPNHFSSEIHINLGGNKPDLKRKTVIDLEEKKEINHLDFCDYLAGSPPNTPTIAEDCQMVSPKKRRP